MTIAPSGWNTSPSTRSLIAIAPTLVFKNFFGAPACSDLDWRVAKLLISLPNPDKGCPILSRSVRKGGIENADTTVFSNPSEFHRHSADGTQHPHRLHLLPPLQKRKDGAPFVRYESRRSKSKPGPPAPGTGHPRF